MNFEPRHARRQPNGSDAELDALVVREVEALVARSRAPAGKRRDDDPPLAPASEPDAGRDPGKTAPNSPRAHRPEPPDERPAPSRADNVIGLRHAEPERSGAALFSADEEKFIEQALAFLKGRPNADAVIEELWTHAVLDRDDGLDEQLDAAMRAGDPAEPEDGADDIDDRLLAEDAAEAAPQPPDRVTPIRADRPANDMAAPLRPAPTEAAAKPPKPDRPKTKSSGGPDKRGPTE
jgi:hypothetical protein